MLKNAVTREYHHVQALLAAGCEQLTSSYWFPDAAFDAGNVGLRGLASRRGRVWIGAPGDARELAGGLAFGHRWLRVSRR